MKQQLHKKKASKIFVILPAYNEAKRIGSVIDNTKKYCKNIIVVDDSSKDNTSAIAMSHGVAVLRHIVNLGKGGAMKTGSEYAISQGATHIIMMDSDGQHDPKDINTISKYLKEGYDMVYGSRRFNKNMPAVRKFGNFMLTKMMQLLFGLKIHDALSGYRGFSTSAYRKIKWKSNGYEVEAEINCNAGKRNLKYKEFIIDTIYHDSYKGMTVIDGLKLGINILFWRLRI